MLRLLRHENIVDLKEAFRRKRKLVRSVARGWDQVARSILDCGHLRAVGQTLTRPLFEVHNDPFAWFTAPARAVITTPSTTPHHTTSTWCLSI